jgi:hypothetical protein
MSENVKQENQVNEFYLKFRSNPTSSFIDHKDIYSLLMSYANAEDKLRMINNITQAEPPFENLKGLNKSAVIDKIVKPILANSKPEDIMMFKADVNALKDASEAKYKKYEKTEKGDIKFIPPKVSSEEYMQFLVDNKHVIVNAEKNATLVSTALLLLAYKESNNKGTMHDILVKSGVNPDIATDFIKSDVFNHTPITNEIKKSVTKEINADAKNVETFKNLTNLNPTLDKVKDIDVNIDQRSGRKI